MTWKTKTKRLIGEIPVATIERRAKWTRNTLRNALNSRGRASPGADKALRLAKALSVTCDWLFDDSQNWPPPSPDVLTEADPEDVLRMLAQAFAVAADALPRSGGRGRLKDGRSVRR